MLTRSVVVKAWGPALASPCAPGLASVKLQWLVGIHNEPSRNSDLIKLLTCVLNTCSTADTGLGAGSSYIKDTDPACLQETIVCLSEWTRKWAVILSVVSGWENTLCLGAQRRPVGAGQRSFLRVVHCVGLLKKFVILALKVWHPGKLPSS